MEAGKNLGYDIKSRNDIFEAINNIVNHNYTDSLACSDEMLIATALSYFILSKEDVVTTDKSNSDINSKHTSNVCNTQLFDFFKDSEVTRMLSKYSYSAIIAIIRNCLCHGSSKVDFENKVVHINSTHGDLNINESIPFSFFFDYIKTKLSNKKDMKENSVYVYSAYKNPEHHNFYSPDTSFDEYLFLNGIVPLKITGKSQNGTVIEHGILKSFVRKFEFSFSKKYFNFKNANNNLNEYLSLFIKTINNSFSRLYPGCYLEVSVENYPEEAEIFHTVEQYKNNNLYFNSSELSSLINEKLFYLDGGVIDFLPYYYDAISHFQSLKDFYGSFVYMPLSEKRDNNGKRDIDIVSNEINFIRNHECLTLTALLYMLGTNAILVNDNAIRYGESNNIPESFLFYSRFTNNDPNIRQAILNRISDYTNRVNILSSNLSHMTDERKKKTTISNIHDLKKQIEFDKKYFTILNEQGKTISKFTYDQRDNLDNGVTSINDGNSKFVLTQDGSSIDSIIRNAFAHPGRIKVIKNKHDEYSVEILDIDDNGAISKRGYASLEDFLFYITKGSMLTYDEHNKQRTA